MNLVINNYCNQKCEYCFAEDIITCSKKNMTISTMQKILQFGLNSGCTHYGIVGGEPTIHPQFEDILNELSVFSNNNPNIYLSLYTNGTNLSRYLEKLPHQMRILINVNAPEKITEACYLGTMQSIEKAAYMGYLNGERRRITLGCNLYPGLSDYTYIWDLCRTFEVPNLRVSVVSPGGKYKHLCAERDYFYWKMKDLLLQFCNDAISNGVTLNMDCGHIPECYFTLYEFDLIRRAFHDYRIINFCEPHVDVNADLEISSCLIMSANQNKLKITDFNNMHEIENYLLTKYVIPKYQGTEYGKCSSCEKHKLMKCQGGCLGFSLQE